MLLMRSPMYVGPPVDDPAILDRLPGEYRALLARANGYVAYHGGLHLRGACFAPEWHSLRAAWDGARSPTVKECDSRSIRLPANVALHLTSARSSEALRLTGWTALRSANW